jgi:hypothetical protein
LIFVRHRFPVSVDSDPAESIKKAPLAEDLVINNGSAGEFAAKRRSEHALRRAFALCHGVQRGYLHSEYEGDPAPSVVEGNRQIRTDADRVSYQQTTASLLTASDARPPVLKQPCQRVR